MPGEYSLGVGIHDKNTFPERVEKNTVGCLRPYARNAKTHDADQVARIASAGEIVQKPNKRFKLFGLIVIKSGGPY